MCAPFRVLILRDGRLMLFQLQQGQFGRGSGGSVDLVYMDFEGADGSTTFDDSGAGASVWTASGNAQIDTGVVLAGTSSLLIPALNADYIGTPYAVSNGLPPRGDWDIVCRVTCNNWDLGGVGKTFISAQSAAAAAADTAFAIACNSSQQLVVILSDGTTRSVIAISSGSMLDGTTYDISAARRGNTVSIGFGPGTGGSGSFTGAIHMPVGRTLRVGNQEGNNTGAAVLSLDSFRIRIYR